MRRSASKEVGEKEEDGRAFLARLSKRYNIALREDRQIEQRIISNLQKEYSPSRSSVHVSDLTLCLRQALFRKISPIEPTEKQIGYFLDGARRHEALQKLYQGNDPAHIITEKKGSFEGVNYSIDIYHSIPIEFKTTRASEGISEHWLRQLAYYMLATNSNVGILQLQRIVPRTSASIFPAYLLEFTNEEQRLYWYGEFLERKNAFINALNALSLDKAPIYRGEGTWVCNECQYRSKCDEIELKGRRSGKNRRTRARDYSLKL